MRELLGGKPKGEIKVKTAYAVLDTILDFGLGGVSSHLCGSSVGWRKSVNVGTRKMVNYARAERSQRKLWWRFVAVLTCKSIVRLGYRGERLIEPSSSWFPPKFPSG